jgi:hypothetical protein
MFYRVTKKLPEGSPPMDPSVVLAEMARRLREDRVKDVTIEESSLVFRGSLWLYLCVPLCFLHLVDYCHVSVSCERNVLTITAQSSIRRICLYLLALLSLILTCAYFSGSQEGTMVDTGFIVGFIASVMYLVVFIQAYYFVRELMRGVADYAVNRIIRHSN